MASKPCTDISCDEILQCSICMELIADPRALPCLHSYCYKCISSWCSNKNPGNQVACPLCRKEFVIPKDGIEHLQKNFFIENLLSLNQLKSAEAKTEVCETCLDVVELTDKLAVFFCLECQQRMCASCSKIHARMKIGCSHKLVSLDDISADSDIYSKYQSLKCDKHVEKKIEVFCLDCKTTLCMMCYIKDHSSHKCSDVAEVAAEFRIGLKQDIVDIAKAIETYDDNLTKIKQNGDRFSAKAKEVEAEINSRSDQLIEEIEAERLKLIADLNATVEDHQKEILNATEEMALNKSLVQRSLNYYRELLQKGSVVDIAREASSLHTRAEELRQVKSVAEALKDLSVVDVSFSASVLTYSHPESILGVVLNKGVEPTLLTTSSQVVTVVAIAFCDTELFVSHANSNWISQVSVYDSVSLQLKRQIPVPGMLYPNGLAACSTNKCLYISDYFYRCLRRLDISAVNSTNTPTQWTVGRCPGHLSVTKAEHNVLVAYEEGGGLAEYSPTGTLIRSLFSNSTIYHAIELNNDTLAVHQLQPVRGIFKTSKDGTVQREFKEISGETFCLAADSYGNIVYPDKSNNRIRVVSSSSSTCVRTLPLPASVTLKSPHALCFDENEGRLYVGGGSDLPVQYKKANQVAQPQYGNVFGQRTQEPPYTPPVFSMTAFNVMHFF